jgi:anti-sigma regulatory factor (Ser/Thr protein kinase)
MGHRRQFSAFVTKDSNPAPAIRHSLKFVREFLAEHQFEPRLQVKLAILVEELVTNALHHGGKSQDLALLLGLAASEGCVALRLEDNGPAFDPLAVPPVKAPDPTTGGGIGLAIVQAWAEEAQYTDLPQGNLLSLTLR